ncbi:MAG: RNA polymerase sigma factor [Deltaproteobacteria bacterium]|nr:RNA polymerase sigma factor [Deltaproteobacteria bacterium]
MIENEISFIHLSIPALTRTRGLRIGMSIPVILKPTSNRTVIRKETSECVWEFIDRLPSDYKTDILLSEHEGFKNREVADILQVLLDTVEIRLHRAKVMLKKKLNDGCIFYNSEQKILACDRRQSQILPNTQNECRL